MYRSLWPDLLGLGQAICIGVYDYLGYYDICYIGEEVRNPGKVTPRLILISLVVIAVVYFTMNLSIIGVVPWREFVPAAGKAHAQFIASIFMERIYGPAIAMLFTGLVLWTTFGSVFALLLGYSRIPYAAARDGYFFKVFARLHPTKHFPHVSLLLIGLLSILCCAFPLDVVIDALITTRILVQFLGQVFAVIHLRNHSPSLARPYRMWLYPLPALVAYVGWMFLFLSAQWWLVVSSVGMIAAGLAVFCI